MACQAPISFTHLLHVYAFIYIFKCMYIYMPLCSSASSTSSSSSSSSSSFSSSSCSSSFFPSSSYLLLLLLLPSSFYSSLYFQFVFSVIIQQFVVHWTQRPLTSDWKRSPTKGCQQKGVQSPSLEASSTGEVVSRHWRTDHRCRSLTWKRICSAHRLGSLRCSRATNVSFEQLKSKLR